MKRIAGSFVLLMGLSGCITFAPPNQGDKKANDVKVAPIPAPTTLAQAAPAPVAPPAAPGNWDVDPNPLRTPSYTGDHTAARPTSPYAQPPYPPAPTPAVAQAPYPPAPTPVVAAPNPGPQPATLPSLVPVVTTPRPSPVAAVVPTAPAAPAAPPVMTATRW